MLRFTTQSAFANIWHFLRWFACQVVTPSIKYKNKCQQHAHKHLKMTHEPFQIAHTLDLKKQILKTFVLNNSASIIKYIE